MPAAQMPQVDDACIASLAPGLYVVTLVDALHAGTRANVTYLYVVTVLTYKNKYAHVMRMTCVAVVCSCTDGYSNW